MATIREVAELAEVSVATVSRVLNNNGDVSEEKAKRVRAAAKKLNYALSHSSANAPAAKRTTILALLPNMVKSFYDDIIKGIQQSAKEDGYDVVLGVCNNDRFVEAEHIEKLVDGSVAARRCGPRRG